MTAAASTLENIIVMLLSPISDKCLTKMPVEPQNIPDKTGAATISLFIIPFLISADYFISQRDKNFHLKVDLYRKAAELNFVNIAIMSIPCRLRLGHRFLQTFRLAHAEGQGIIGLCAVNFLLLCGE